MRSSKATNESPVSMKRKAEDLPETKQKARSSIKKDTWVFQGKEFRTIEGVMPSALTAAFQKPVSPAKNVEPYDYDRSILSVYCISGVSDAEIAARVELVKGPFFIADVIPMKDDFKIHVYPTGQGLFSLSPAEFLRAVYAAKLNIFLKTDNGDDD